MIVYGHRSFDLDPRRFLLDLHASVSRAGANPQHAVLIAWLVEIGEAEAAVTDALMPDADTEAKDLREWRIIAGSLAESVCASHYREADAVAPALERACRGIERVLSRPLPPVVRARRAEGFACYSLYPEQYMAASAQMIAKERPASVFCLGLRSIGGVLAHVAAAALQRHGVPAIVRSARPRGHPFDRRLRLDPSMSELIENCRCDTYVIVDEGPGMSGSSFAAAAEQLLQLGIAANQIVLMPSWDADPERLRSERGRRTWHAHRRYVGDYNPFDDYSHAADLSAGRWRGQVLAPDDREWPAVQPQHERPKFLDAAGGRIARFAGVGQTASRRRTRAELLHGEGFGPAVRDLRNGVLELEWLEGQPLRSASATFLAHAAEYLAITRWSFPVRDCDDVAELAAMAETNAAEAGMDLDIQGESFVPAAAATQRVAIDGRMMPHEWIDTGRGFKKVDALDHHDDDFFPGCRDIAWDVAGLCIEFDLDRSAADFLIERYRRTSGDQDIMHRLPFYEAAYAAYRLGYARMASESVGDAAESRRFQRLELMYADRLRRFQRSA